MTAAAWPQGYKQTAEVLAIDASDSANFNDVTYTGGQTGTVSTDASVTFEGHATTKIALDSNGGTRNVNIGVLSGGFAPGLGFNGCVTWAVKVADDGSGRFANPDIYVRVGDGTYTNYFEEQFAKRAIGYFQFGEWQYITVTPEDYTATGSMSIADCVRARLSFAMQAGAATTIWVGGVWATPRTRPKVVIIFDDGVDEMYSWLRPEAITYNIPISFAVAREFIDLAGYMTEAQAIALNDDSSGLFECVNHAYHAESFTTDYAGNVATMLADFQANRDWMNSVGMTRGSDLAVYPRGEHDEALMDAMLGAGFNAARAAARGPFGGITTWRMPDDRRIMSLPLVTQLDSADTLGTVKTRILNAIRNGNTGIVMGHKLEAAAGVDTFAQADMTNLLAWLAGLRAQGLCDVVRFSDWHLGLTQPALAASA